MIYLLLAEGFEEIEALAPVDLLRRGGCEVTTLSVGSSLNVVGSHGIGVNADALLSDIGADELAKAELIVLPGGMPGTVNIGKSEAAREAIRLAYDNGARLAAICAAPSVLGEMGLLEGKRAVCYPGFEDKLTGAKVGLDGVVTDGRITTARGAGVAVRFALELVALIRGKEISEKIEHGIIVR